MGNDRILATDGISYSTKGGNVMTVDEKVEAYRMRLCGATYQEIADKFGITKQRINQILPCRTNRLKKAVNSCIYRGIANWMQENECSYTCLAIKNGLTKPTIFDVLTGKNSPRKKTIDSILKVTGLTYEEAFGELKSESEERV